MRQLGLSLYCVLAISCIAAGCGGADGIELAEARGTITYRDAPLAGALVTFVPDKGPIASGTTDLEGKYTLSTGAMQGVAIGPCRVSVEALAPGSEKGGDPVEFGTPKSEAEMTEHINRISQMEQEYAEKQAAGDTGPKSIIPERYSKASTSGLTATVTTDPAKNVFDFALTD